MLYRLIEYTFECNKIYVIFAVAIMSGNSGIYMNRWFLATKSHLSLLCKRRTFMMKPQEHKPCFDRASELTVGRHTLVLCRLYSTICMQYCV